MRQIPFFARFWFRTGAALTGLFILYLIHGLPCGAHSPVYRLGFIGDATIAENLIEDMNTLELDDITLSHCSNLTSKLFSGRTAPYLEREAAGSNFASEYPLVGYLLDFGI